MFKIGILSLGLIGCGNINPLQSEYRIINQTFHIPHEISEDLKPYVKAFENTFKVSIGLTSVILKSTKRPAIGLAYRYSNGDKEIHIDPVYWDKANEYERMNLLAHEFGHALFNRDHNENLITFSNGVSIPESIMSPSIMNSETFKEYYNYYIKELKYGD